MTAFFTFAVRENFKTNFQMSYFFVEQYIMKKIIVSRISILKYYLFFLIKGQYFIVLLIKGTYFIALLKLFYLLFKKMHINYSYKINFSRNSQKLLNFFCQISKKCLDLMCRISQKFVDLIAENLTQIAENKVRRKLSLPKFRSAENKVQ